MVQRNLKKLLFLMVLLLGVGQTAQAKRLYADLEQIEATEEGTTWTVESESGTFAWTNDGSYITLFANETGFADYNCLCFSHGEMTQHIDLYLVVNEEEIRLSPNDGYWSKNQDRVIDIRDYYDGDLADANEIRMYGYGDNGSVVLSDICLAKKLEFNDEGVAEVALSDFEATGGVSINLVDNTVSCDGTEGTLILDVVDEDFSNVASVITSWDTNENSGYTDLFAFSILRQPFYRLRVIMREEQAMPQIQLADILHVLITKCKVKYVEILLHTFFTDRFRYDNHTPLDKVAQSGLRSTLTIFRSNSIQCLVAEEIITAFGKWSPRHDVRTVLLHNLLRINLLVKDMRFHLVDHRSNLAKFRQINKAVRIEV